MRGSLLGDVSLTEISKIVLDNWADELTVELQLHVGESGERATYEETLTFDRKTPSYLTEAALNFAKACQRMMQERLTHQGDVPCDTCVGSCCHIETGAVRMTKVDVDRLSKAYGYPWVVDHANFYDTASFTGYVAEMKMVDLDHPGADLPKGTHGCINSTRVGCSIYEFRPQVCRDYSPWDNCRGQEGSLYKEDLEKVAGKVKLRVVRA